MTRTEVLHIHAGDGSTPGAGWGGRTTRDPGEATRKGWGVDGYQERMGRRVEEKEEEGEDRDELD